MGHRILVLRKLLVAATRNIMGTITHFSTQDDVAALTFDDGPHPEYTLRLLDILDKYQAHATFFMIGKFAQRYPELVKQVAQAGHAIGNHSWDHPSFPLITGEERRRQVRACAGAIAPYGHKLFRPPYGHQNIPTRLDIVRLRYQIIGWNVVAHDWLDHDANWMVDRMVSEIQPGSIILFHDALYDFVEESHTDRNSTLQAVDMLLEYLCDRFQFVTVPQLLRHGTPQRQNWMIDPDRDFLNSLEVKDGEAKRYP